MNNNGQPTCDICGGDLAEEDPVVELRLGEFTVQQRFFSVSHELDGDIYDAFVHLSCIDAPHGADRGQTLRLILDSIGVRDVSPPLSNADSPFGDPELPEVPEND
ncbi:hypothetical protein AUR64_10305 [Haloprofundus marisrubri]|uniref:Uncharacterized protein n=1 Tax=Haloprofundus marisrubri TaxID=1514971 RepID=A0A0W1RA78_9EURY|nr:hypothetical protein [Haloprofundus marisrubri]KTG09989.1 hypothetical protein AUR64_10305 [Haloprofundus marisrubri]